MAEYFLTSIGNAKIFFSHFLGNGRVYVLEPPRSAVIHSYQDALDFFEEKDDG